MRRLHAWQTHMYMYMYMNMHHSTSGLLKGAFLTTPKVTNVAWDSFINSSLQYTDTCKGQISKQAVSEGDSNMQLFFLVLYISVALQCTST